MRNEIDRGEAASVALRIFAAVFPAQQSARERAPYKDSDTGILDKRDNLMFYVAAD